LKEGYCEQQQPGAAPVLGMVLHMHNLQWWQMQLLV
jgi:hypothetical protein